MPRVRCRGSLRATARRAHAAPPATETLEPRIVLSAGLAPELASALGVSTLRSTAPIFVDPLFAASSPFVGPSSTSWGSLMRIDELRADSRFGFADGAGYAAVVLDTGIDLDHPFFGPDSDLDGVADRIVYHYDFAENDDNATDFNGHGSNVSSIIASQDENTPGIAPGVDIIHLKVFGDSGGGTFGYIEQALQWVVANVANFNIITVNMSLSDSLNHSSPKTRYGIGDEIAALAALGVTVVSAAGNRFEDFTSKQGVAYPAADPNSLAVGATYAADIGGPVGYASGARAFTTGPDRLAPFSQRHETLIDVFAPGAPIRGAGPNGNTISLHGTSQASPQVAGAVVLAQQIAETYLGRRLDLGEIRTLLAESAATINDGDDEDDNITNTGLDFGRLDIFALAEAIWALIPTNAAPVIGNIADFDGAVAGQTFTFDYDALLAASDASDPDADPIVFVIESVTAGVLRQNGADVVPGVTTLAPGGSLIWAAPEDAFGITEVFRVRVFDGSEMSAGEAAVRVGVNGLPTLASIADLVGAQAYFDFAITYDDILNASDAFDPDGDELRFVVSLLGDGAFTLDDEPVTGETTIGPGQTLVWTPGVELSGRVTALLLRVTDGVSLSENSVLLTVEVDPAPDPFAAAPGAGVSGVAGDDAEWVVTRNIYGGVALLRRAFEGAPWERVDLSALLDLEHAAADIVSWTDPNTGHAAFAVPTLSGLHLLTDAGVEGWQTVNLSAVVPGARPLAASLTSFETIDGRIGVAGLDDDGALLLYIQDEAEPDGWRFEDLSADHLAAGGQATPAFAGRLISYVTSWNALHIAGLDTSGAIRAVWRAPGMDLWRADNLSAITGAPRLSGGLTAFITTWGAVNLAGVAESGELTVTWWMPSFAGAWRTDNLTASIAGPRLQAVGASSFVTPWGGLNVVGLDASGELSVYWWAPGLDTWRVAALSAIVDGAEAPVSAVTGVQGPTGELMLLGAAESGDVLRFAWRPGEAWSFENLTRAA